MADPGNHSEFSSDELDRLEDALERWTAADVEPVPEDSLLAPRLRERLEDYRSLLEMTRAELPMEDVPDGLLADVLAEARQNPAGIAATHKPSRPLAAAGPGFWERLRRSMLLPGFALAGSAALLLWMVQPGEDMAPSTLARNDAPKSEARLAPEAGPAPAAAQEPEMDAIGGIAEEKADREMAAPGAAAGAAAAPPPAAPADKVADALADPAAVPKDMSPERGDRKATTKSKKAEAAAPIESYPGLDDAPAAEGDKEALRDTLEQADGARRKGNCGEAMTLYLAGMGMSGASSEQAQARAGYGLCLMQQGKDDAADKYFEAARKLSSGIESWIKRERGDGPAKKSPAKPSAKAKLEPAGM